MPLFEKINTIVQRIYRGSEAIADKSVRDQLHAWEKAGYGNLPVCMAKTQYSFSTDPNLRGAPTGHVGAGPRGAAVGRRRLRRRHLRRDHDHARACRGAVFGEDHAQREGRDRGPVLGFTVSQFSFFGAALPCRAALSFSGTG